MQNDLLDRADILELFTLLAERLKARGVRGNVYVIGGAAISLVFDARRTTRDVDSVVLDGHGPLMEEVRKIGRERGLPGSWLNEQAAMYVSRVSDEGKAVVFDHPNLVVTSASPEHLLAMKLMAARGSDADDIQLLLRNLSITTVAEALAVLDIVFPGAEPPDRARLLLDDVLNR